MTYIFDITKGKSREELKKLYLEKSRGLCAAEREIERLQDHLKSAFASGYLNGAGEADMGLAAPTPDERVEYAYALFEEFLEESDQNPMSPVGSPDGSSGKGMGNMDSPKAEHGEILDCPTCGGPYHTESDGCGICNEF